MSWRRRDNEDDHDDDDDDMNGDGKGEDSNSKDTDHTVLERLVRENEVLIAELVFCQEVRSRSSRVVKALPQEDKIADRLRNNLAVLLQKVPTTLPQLPMENAMKYLQAFDPNYKGALPLAKPFAFKLNAPASVSVQK